jgi:hypothetical protein
VDHPEIVYRSIAGGVYHCDLACPVGRLIPAEWRLAERGGYPLCPACRARSEARRGGGVPSPSPDVTEA